MRKKGRNRVSRERETDSEGRYRGGEKGGRDSKRRGRVRRGETESRGVGDTEREERN